MIILFIYLASICWYLLCWENSGPNERQDYSFDRVYTLESHDEHLDQYK